MHPDVVSALDALFADQAVHGVSLATVVLHHGRRVVERYGHQPDTVFGPGGEVGPDTTLISWSMAKSITHALVGLMLDDGLLQLDAPVAAPEFTGDKAHITLAHLLDMKSGLEFVEDYVDGSVSNCLEMLFAAGAADMAGYAAALPLRHPPGSVWNYSSGTTNIICRLAGQALGGRPQLETYLRERLFEPCGMRSAVPKFDDAGTFVGSSYVYATARDFAAFGEMYRNDGMVVGRRVIPAGWAAHAATVVAHDTDFDYGRHWWVWRDQPGSLAAHGYEGQFIVVVPSRHLVVTHLGKCPADRLPLLVEQLRRVVNAFPSVDMTEPSSGIG